MYFEANYPIDTRAIDPLGHCRPSALLGYLQEAATDAALAIHVSREEMLAEHNAFWVLARMWYRLDTPLKFGDTLTVHTWHRGGKGASMYRDFDLYRDGVLIGEAVSVWALADWNSQKLLRLSAVAGFVGTDGGDRCKDKLLPKLKMPVEVQPAETRILHYSDCDINGHVNNTRYADFLCDAMGLHRAGDGHFVSEVEISFLGQCYPGESMTLRLGTDGDTWYGRGEDDLGEARFHGKLTLTALDKEPDFT